MTRAREKSETVRQAKAWVNFDGTFATSPFTEKNGGIRGSLNVDSVTDNDTGDYTINFTKAFPNKNYTWLGTAGEGYDTTSINGSPSPFATRTAIVNTDTFRFYCCHASSNASVNGGKLDRECVTLIFFGSSRTNAQNGLYQTPLSIFDQRGKGSLHSTILTSFDQRGEGGLYQTPLAAFDQRGKGVLHSTTLTGFDQRGEGSLHSTSSTLTSFDQRGEGALYSTDADSIP